MNRSDVCGIVVTYHPDADFPARLRSISSQLDLVLIVDNGSAEPEVSMLRNVAAHHSGITLILNSENLGIARALNIGIQQAAMLGYSWVVLLDQDSRVHDDLLDTLLAIHESHPDNTRLAVIGSGYRDLRWGRPEQGLTEPNAEAASGNRWDEVEWVITSGSLLSLAAYSVIGPFREDFFIDFVDIEYCIRARASGYSVIKTRRSLMSHLIGALQQHQILWIKKWTTHHSADRRYYFARNDTVMLREYGNYKWGTWRIKSFCRSFRTVKRIVLYEQAKAGKILAIIHGWWDGIHGNMGPRRQAPLDSRHRLANIKQESLPIGQNGLNK
jgi:rhamnosyltransferase